MLEKGNTRLLFPFLRQDYPQFEGVLLQVERCDGVPADTMDLVNALTLLAGVVPGPMQTYACAFAQVLMRNINRACYATSAR